MSKVLNLSEGVRIGIPFRAQKTIRLDEDRFEDYPYNFPENSGITLIEAAEDIENIYGHYGMAKAEITSLSESPSGYQYITLTIERIEIEGKLSLTREERAKGMGYRNNLNKFGNDKAGPSSTVDKINRGF